MTVELMSDRSDNSLHVSPERILKEALADVGERDALKNGKKVLIIAVDDTDGGYAINWYRAGMNTNDCIVLTEIAKKLFREELGY